MSDARTSKQCCPNPTCTGGEVPIAVLLDTPQEIYVLAKHLPNSKPHIMETTAPCPTCRPELREIWERQRAK